MTVKWIEENYGISMTKGKIYEVLEIQDDFWYRVVDDTNEDYLYPIECFEIVDDSDYDSIPQFVSDEPEDDED